jgi:peptidoglycan-N-acetylglucosamine deacetylase
MQAETPTGSYRRAARAAQVRRRRLVALAVVALLVLVTGVALTTRGSGTPAASPTTSPAAPATTTAAAATLPGPVPGKGRLVFNGPENVPKVALTFDDGSCEACIASVLTTLEQTGTPATLFPNGAYERFWDPHAEQIRKLVASGQLDLGNHTWSHNDVRTMSAATLKGELQRNEDWMRINFGATSFPLFRPPFGTYNDAAVRRAGKWGWTATVTWSAGSRDWEGLDADAIVAELDKSVKAGSIILLHPNFATTAAALPRIIASIKAKGLQPVTLHALLGV